MRIEPAEIVTGLWTRLVQIADALTVHLRDVDAGMAVLVSVFIGIFCGAWFRAVSGPAGAGAAVGLAAGVASPVAAGVQRLVRVPGLRHADQGEVSALLQPLLGGVQVRVGARLGWGKKDKRSDAFYVYVLELDGGKSLYAGQTRNLMRRMQEHCAGMTKTTRGRRPVLAWFEQVPSRQAAVEKEADLKHRIDRQPEGVHQMVAAFRSR